MTLGTTLSATRQGATGGPGLGGVGPGADEGRQVGRDRAQRLQSLSWFMKCLKEPLSRLANCEEQTRGAFFERRFKSVAILDEESLLAT